MPSPHRAWVEIDQAALGGNLAIVRRLAGERSVTAVRKAHAHGHGATRPRPCTTTTVRFELERLGESTTTISATAWATCSTASCRFCVAEQMSALAGP